MPDYERQPRYADPFNLSECIEYSAKGWTVPFEEAVLRTLEILEDRTEKLESVLEQLQAFLNKSARK